MGGKNFQGKGQKNKKHKMNDLGEIEWLMWLMEIGCGNIMLEREKYLVISIDISINSWNSNSCGNVCGSNSSLIWKPHQKEKKIPLLVKCKW